MHDYETTDEKRIDRRTIRAATQSMTVAPTGKGRFDVYNVEGRRYGVSHVDGTCSCPDFERRGASLPDGCKHIQRVEMEAGIREIPDLGPRRLDVEIARDSRERKAAPVAMTDGGTATVEPETGGENDEDTHAHADGCDNPECEGYGADGRPLLSRECWAEWARYNESETIVRSVDEVEL